MDVIDVLEGQVRMERRVDAGSHAALSERAERQQIDHVVFLREPAVLALEAEQAGEVQDGEPGAGHGAEVSPRTLDPQRAGLLAGERVGLG